jgi:signal transduction histidine kinase
VVTPAAAAAARRSTAIAMGWGHGGWAVALMVALTMAILVLRPSGQGGAAARQVQAIERADFRHEAQPAYQPVALPHDWPARGLALPGRGHYRAAFTLPAVPEATWALRADEIAVSRRLWINGALLHEQQLPPALWRLRRPVTALVELPPALLRPGRNLIELELDYGSAARLSGLAVGPMAELTVLHRAEVWLWDRLPQALNLAATGLALFMLAVWWQRRSEAAIGSFGLLWLLLSVRNITYYHAEAAPIGVFASWVFYVPQVASVVLVGQFAMALTRRRPRRRLRVLAGIALVLPLAGLVALMADQITLLRRWTYPLLVALYLPSIVLMVGATRGLRGRTMLPVVLGQVATVGSGVHDLLYAFGHARLAGRFLLPFVTPLTMAVFAWLLVRRMSHGLVRVERQKDALERRVAERTQELEQANAAKSRFITAASHDLRQPVVSLGLMAGLLRDEPEGPAARRLVEQMSDAAGALERLMQGLLDLSRVERGRDMVRLQPVALDALFRDIALHAGEPARAKGIELRVRPAGLQVRSDPVLLEQIVRNLVDNAVRYTDRGGVPLAARRGADGGVRVQVWDTGRGIDPAEQAAVFDEFVRAGADPHARRPGAGLGLAIARRAAQALGHGLRLASRPGRGSCFTLRI